MVEKETENDPSSSLKDGESDSKSPFSTVECGICFERIKVFGKLDACQHPFCLLLFLFLIFSWTELTIFR